MAIYYTCFPTEATPEAVVKCAWLLFTTRQSVEREAERVDVSEWRLMQHRYEIESSRVQRAPHILDAGGFVVPDQVE